MRIGRKYVSLIIGSAGLAICSSGARAQLPSLVPPVEISVGGYTASGNGSDSGLAARASVSLSLPGNHGIAASAWYLDANPGHTVALTGEFRKRFGPLSVGYWAVGGGVGSSNDNGPLKDGAVWTAGLGATLAGLSVEGRVLSSFKSGTALMGLVGYRF